MLLFLTWTIGINHLFIIYVIVNEYKKRRKTIYSLLQIGDKFLINFFLQFMVKNNGENSIKS